MLGTIVNAAAIILGSAIGSIIHRGIKGKYIQVLYTGLGLCTITLGLNTAIVHMKDSHYPVLFILSLALGGLLGTALRLDDRMNHLAEHISGAALAKGLTTGIMLFCIGTLSMVGPMMSALYGDNTYLFTNATLDLVSSSILASTYGFGMALAAPVLFCWQGSIYLLTCYVRDFVSQELITETSIVGGVLIVATGLTLLDIKNCKAMNFLPALFIPALYFLFRFLLF